MTRFVVLALVKEAGQRGRLHYQLFPVYDSVARLDYQSRFQRPVLGDLGTGIVTGYSPASACYSNRIG